MKKLSRFLTKITACMVLIALAFSMVSCKDKNGDSNDGSGTQPGQEYQGIEISLSLSADTIKYGETVLATVTVKNSDKSYFLSSTAEDLIEISGKNADGKNEITLKSNALRDRTVAITAVSREDSSVKDTVNLRVVPKTIEGELSGLTSDMIEAIGGENITVTAQVTDYYEDFVDSSYNSAASYKSVVKMDEDLWYGSWTSIDSTTGKEGVWTSNIYGKGTEDVETYDENLGTMTTGKPVQTYYVDKNNQVAAKNVTTYDSFPVLWNNQHYWNHLGQLDVNNFVATSDELGDYYKYKIDPNEMDPDEPDSLWLPTYLVYSMTAMVADTFHSLGLFVNDGKITKIVGVTEYLYYLDGEITTADYAEYLTYTEIVIDLSDIGTTEIPMPEPYVAADAEKNTLLKNAIAEMQAADNYTVSIVENTTSAPSYDSGDYEITSAKSENSGVVATSTNPFKPNSSTGVVGKVIQVTEDEIFVEETGKYSYGMDDKLYYFTYYGYKNVSETMYDYCELDGGFMAGKHSYAGSVQDALPGFNFASELFQYTGTSVENGHSYTLKDAGAIREIGIETVFEEGHYAAASTRGNMTITVGTDGKIKQIVVPYNISDIYLGNYIVTFSNVGSTVIDEAVFEGYEPRVIPTTWAQVNSMYFVPNPLESDIWQDADAETVIASVWGKSSTEIGLPTPAELIAIFGDRLTNMFYDYSIETDENGVKTVVDKEVSITGQVLSSDLDENGVLLNEKFNPYYEKINALLISKGFTCIEKNIDGGETGRQNRKLVYTNEHVKIVLSNIFTAYMYFDFYTI